MQGYIAPGTEILDNLREESGSIAIHELRESFNVSDTSETALFPDKMVPDMRSDICRLENFVVGLAQRVFAALSLSLGLKKTFFESLHTRLLSGGEGSPSKIRSLYYPAIMAEDLKPGVTRCGEHSDYGTITFLFQENPYLTLIKQKQI